MFSKAVTAGCTFLVSAEALRSKCFGFLPSRRRNHIAPSSVPTDPVDQADQNVHDSGSPSSHHRNRVAPATVLIDQAKNPQGAKSAFDDVFKNAVDDNAKTDAIAHLMAWLNKPLRHAGDRALHDWRTDRDGVYLGEKQLTDHVLLNEKKLTDHRHQVPAVITKFAALAGEKTWHVLQLDEKWFANPNAYITAAQTPTEAKFYFDAAFEYAADKTDAIAHFLAWLDGPVSGHVAPYTWEFDRDGVYLKETKYSDDVPAGVDEKTKLSDDVPTVVTKFAGCIHGMQPWHILQANEEWSKDPNSYIDKAKTPTEAKFYFVGAFKGAKNEEEQTDATFRFMVRAKDLYMPWWSVIQSMDEQRHPLRNSNKFPTLGHSRVHPSWTQLTTEKVQPPRDLELAENQHLHSTWKNWLDGIGSD